MGNQLASCFDEVPALMREGNAPDRPLPPAYTLASNKGTLRHDRDAYERIEHSVGGRGGGAHRDDEWIRGRDAGAESEDLIVRRALDVVAERYVHQPSHLTPEWSSPLAPRRPQQTAPGTALKTVFSCRKTAPDSERRWEAGEGRALLNRFDAASLGGAAEGRGEASGQEESEGSDSEDGQDCDERGEQFVPNSSLQGRRGGSEPREEREPLLTLDEALPEACGVRLKDMLLCGSSAPPLELLSLRLTKAEWRRHLERSGVGAFVSAKIKGDTPVAT